MSGVPPEGITSKARITKIIDSDTILLEITRSIKVRLLDPDNAKNKLFGCAELNTKEGLEGKKYLEGECLGKEVTVFVPSKDNVKLFDNLTFDRILGEVWLVDGRNVAKMLEEKGYARKNQKEGKSPLTPLKDN